MRSQIAMGMLFHKQLSPRTKIGVLITSITTISTTLLIAAFNGIVGNRSDNLFNWLLTQSTKSMQGNLWPWLITLAILILFLIGTLLGWHHIRVIKFAMKTMNEVVELDDSLLRLLASPVQPGNREEKLRKLLTEILRDTTKAFAGYVHRGSILLPDNEGEYLNPWAHYQMSAESIARTKFYIGNDGNRKRDRGVAGEVFLAGELRVGHIMQEKGIWKCDCDSFIDFDPARPFPPYHSFVLVPIIGLTSNIPREKSTTCLGVVCFDSENPTIFDSEESKILMRLVSRRVATALLIYQQLS